MKMSNRWKYGQLDNLGRLLNHPISVLVYHGNFDLILPVTGMMKALQDVQWSQMEKFRGAPQKPYYFKNGQGVKEILGYEQSGGGLDFVTIRNSGHMVPMDNPAWSLQVVKDFLQKTENSNPRFA